MPSTFRIPRADITGPSGALVRAISRRMSGKVVDGLHVYWHNRPVMNAVFSFERRVARWSALDPHLKTYATMATAAAVGCSWCLDFGYYLAQQDGLDPRTVSEVPRWRSSDAFTPLERSVMAYAEAMTETPSSVTDDQVTELLDALGARAVVELTQIVALENMRARFNAAAGLESQGFSSSCAVPFADVASAPSS